MVVYYFRFMRSLFLYVALFTFFGSGSAQTVLGLFPNYHYLDNPENTSTVKLTTKRLRDFQIVIDDSIKLRVVGAPVFNRFTIRNIPVGNHSFAVTQNRKWPFKERYKQEFTVESTGYGEVILVDLPKRRFCNAFIIAESGFVAACGVWIYLFNSNWGGR
jgi:hypothetical protein